MTLTQQLITASPRHVKGGVGAHMRCVFGHTWIQGEEPIYILTRAETVECTCPDPCERDHSNE
jgi:hypothetical protein